MSSGNRHRTLLEMPIRPTPVQTNKSRISVVPSITMSTSSITQACVLGGGAYGTALAQVIARRGVNVRMWAREKEVVQSINEESENKPFLKGTKTVVVCSFSC